MLSLFLLISSFVMAQEASDALSMKIEAMAKVGACYGASFSPDGSEIVFVSNMSGLPQVWKMPGSGGWPVQLTNFDSPVSGVSWAPKGDRIAFQIAPGGGMNSQVYIMDSKGSDIRKLTVGGKSNNWVGVWSKDGNSISYSSNQDNPAGMDCYLFDITKNERTLIARNYGVGSITDFLDDQSAFLISRLVSRGSNDMFLIDGEGNETILTAHDGPGSFYAEYAPDGAIYMASNLNRDRTAFCAYENGQIRMLSERNDAELQGFYIDHAGTFAYLVWNVAGKNELSIFDLNGNTKEKSVPLPTELMGGGDFSPDDRYFVFNGNGAKEPSNIWVYDRVTDAFSKLTESPHPGVDLESLVSPELVKFKSFDGLELSGWLYRPKMGKAPFPTVISYHGGPEGQSRPSFSYSFQALLSQGIAVFSPNVRGSSGFGKRFVNLDNGALRVNGVKDIQACYDHIVLTGFADKERIGIMGGSYGGYMVMAGITKYPDMFAAAANLFGVVNFKTFFEQTEPWMAAISKVEYGDPDKESDMLIALSPIHEVDIVKTPTIVLHGANDTNVPVVEAEQVVESLKKRNIPVEYVLFEDEGHGWRKTKNKVISTVAIVNWFKKYLKVE